MRVSGPNYQATSQVDVTEADITVIGIGSDDPHALEFVAEMQRRLSSQSKVRFALTGMSAWLQGSAADIFAVAAELHSVPIDLGLPHVYTILKLEERTTHADRMLTSPGSPADHPALSNGHAGRAIAPSVVARPLARAVGIDVDNGPQPVNGNGNGHGRLSTETMPPVPAGFQPMPVALPTGPAAVNAIGLRKTYESGDSTVEALKGVDLTIGRGEFVAVMGPSGSGKSTLMHILGALESPSQGHLEIGGVSYANLSDKQQTEMRRDQIGFVFQFFNLFKTLTAEENVMLPSMLAGQKPVDLRPRALALLGLVGLEKRADHLPSQLSGGEQQRVSIARALMREPELLLADEPTGNLDSKNSAAILDMLGELQRSGGHTILMVTHDPVAASRASRVVFLRDGVIAGEVPGGDRDRIVDFFSRLSDEDFG